MCVYCVCVANGQRVVNVGVSSVCVGGGARRSVGGRQVGRSVGGRRPKSKNPTQ